MIARTERIADFCITGAGGTPSRGKMMRYYDGGTIPWVKSGELREQVITDTQEHVTETALKETGLKVIPSGALLLAMYGATVGRLGILGVPATTNQAVCHIIPDPQTADTRYLFHMLAAQVTTIVARGVGGAQPNISQGFVKSLTVPLPPLTEQRRIAEVLDCADVLRAKRRTTLAQLDPLTQSIFLHMFGDPATNPKGWPVGALGDVARFVGGGTPSRAVPEYFSGSFCWATSKDMKGSFLDDTEEHVTEAAVRNSATKLVPPGTILVVVKSKVLMHRLPVAITRVVTCFGQDLKGIALDERCTPTYVATALRVMQRWLLDRARGVNTEGLSLDHLKRFPLLLPPRSLQEEFERRTAQIELLRQRLVPSLIQLDELFASLQQRAFRGEL